MTSRGAGWLGPLAAAALALALGLAPAAARATVADLWTTLQVKLDLVLAQGTDAFAIDVDTTDALVTLHGTAADDTAKAKAESIARGVGDMRRVRNLIQVVPDAARAPIARSDDETRRITEATLRVDPGLSGVRVASTRAGVVLLAGRVDTLGAHLRALDLAGRVRGVRWVASEIRSPDRLADEEIWRDSQQVPVAPPEEPLRDAWLASVAKLRLLSSRAPALGIDVAARGGVVTLFGIVGSEEERATAHDAVERVAGVRSVRDELQVVDADERAAVERRDAEIAPRVEQRLASEAGLASAPIDVRVSNGVVRLDGEVESPTARLGALALARTTIGVRSVLDDLRVALE